MKRKRIILHFLRVEIRLLKLCSQICTMHSLRRVTFKHVFLEILFPKMIDKISQVPVILRYTFDERVAVA